MIERRQYTAAACRRNCNDAHNNNQVFKVDFKCDHRLIRRGLTIYGLSPTHLARLL